MKYVLEYDIFEGVSSMTTNNELVKIFIDKYKEVISVYKKHKDELIEDADENYQDEYMVAMALGRKPKTVGDYDEFKKLFIAHKFCKFLEEKLVPILYKHNIPFECVTTVEDSRRDWRNKHNVDVDTTSGAILPSSNKILVVINPDMIWDAIYNNKENILSHDITTTFGHELIHKNILKKQTDKDGIIHSFKKEKKNEIHTMAHDIAQDLLHVYKDPKIVLSKLGSYIKSFSDLKDKFKLPTLDNIITGNKEYYGGFSKKQQLLIIKNLYLYLQEIDKGNIINNTKLLNKNT